MILAGLSFGLSALSFGFGISNARKQRRIQTAQIEAEVAFASMRAQTAQDMLRTKQAINKTSQENAIFMIEKGEELGDKKLKLLRAKGRLNIKILNYHLKNAVFDKTRQTTDSVFAYENSSLGISTKLANMATQLQEINREKREHAIQIKTQEILNVLDDDFNQDIKKFNFMQKNLNLNESIISTNFQDLQQTMNIGLDTAQSINTATAQNRMSSLQASQGYAGTFLQGIRNGLNDYNLYKQTKAAEAL